MQAIETDYTQNKAAVVDMLIKNVMNVDRSIPRVVKGDFDL